MLRFRSVVTAITIILTLVLSSAFMARTPLTIEERVKAQEAIERVYYNHRIWPKENPQPKPPFEEMVPKAVIEAKVTDYLKKCVALDKYWQRPIQPEQLQAEMNRMAEDTKAPAMLQELFNALGREPHVIAECLARQMLADRLSYEMYASDERIHGEVRAQARKAREEITPEDFGGYPLGVCGKMTFHPMIDEEAQLRQVVDAENGTHALGEEEFHRLRRDIPDIGTIGFKETAEAFFLALTEASSESEVILQTRTFPKVEYEAWWFGVSQSWVGDQFDEPVTSPDYMNPTRDSAESACAVWKPTSTGTNCPTGRTNHTAVWTGAEMIVWGGESDGGFSRSGGRYSPATDSWVATSEAGAPDARTDHTAVWSGTEMIVWGGRTADGTVDTGGRFNPAANGWTATPRGGECPTRRRDHTAVWTGTEMIVWGGHFASTYEEHTGGRYAPARNTWTATPTGGNCPLGSARHTAIWTGTEMIVWGGPARGRYSPAEDTWKGMSAGEEICSMLRSDHTAVWTGTEMIVWGGRYDLILLLDTGGRYNPATDSWTCTPTGVNSPGRRYDHTAVWTGTEMIVWGGSNGGGRQVTGGRYSVSSNAWTSTSVDAGCPSARYGPTAVWTGTEMIIWGGAYGPTTSTGGSYAPSKDPSPTVQGAYSGCTIPGVALSTQAYSSYQWFLDSVPISGATSQTFTATQTGSYSVAVTDADGCGGSSPAPYVRVHENPSPTVTGPASGCSNPGVALTTQQGFTAYQWTMDGGDIPGEVEADLTARVSGTYAVRVTDNNGCTGGSAEMVVTINDNPLPEIQGSPHGCVSSGAALWTQAAASYLWSKDGEAIPGATSPGITAWESGSYSVQVTDSNGCTGTSQDFAVTISPDPTPTVTGLSAGCPSVEISTETHLGYQWQKDGMDIPGATEQTYEAIESGSYAVHVIDAFDCSGTSGPFTVHICACSLTCTASASPTVDRTALTFSFSATATSTYCAGTESYAWTFGDGLESTEQSPTHTYAIAGTYSWMLTATMDGEICVQTGTVTALSGIPGDCDGDVSVSIGEVQKAINMFLGSQSVGCGVDCNGDGAISIGEVQKVINGFLEILTSC